MDSHDHWFYSVSPREKEARKQEVGMMVIIISRVVSILVRTYFAAIIELLAGSGNGICD